MIHICSIEGEILAKKQKYINDFKKSSSPEQMEQYQPNLSQSTKYACVNETQISSTEGPHPFSRVGNSNF